MVDGDEFIAQRLRTEFPSWNIWRSHDDAGKPHSWYATRNHVLTGAEMYAGLAHTLAYNTPRELRTALERQTELERRIEEEVRRRTPRRRDEAPAFGSAYL